MSPLPGLILHGMSSRAVRPGCITLANRYTVFTLHTLLLSSNVSLPCFSSAKFTDTVLLDVVQPFLSRSSSGSCLSGVSHIATWENLSAGPRDT